MTDAQECRDNAAQCIELANGASGNIRMQRTFYDMAKTWLKLAEQYEGADPGGRALAAPASSPRSS